jgi:hypothetical protein
LRAVVHSRIMAKEQEVASAGRLAAEGGIAPEESAVAEPEIETNKGLSEEHENEPDESAAAEGESCETGCPIWLDSVLGLKCGRKLHIAPDGIDSTPVCLMHSMDPNKQSGPLFDAFYFEFERTLEDAGEGEAYFEWFVFPRLNLRERKFRAMCRFDNAIFTQGATRLTFSFTASLGHIISRCGSSSLFLSGAVRATALQSLN